MGNLYWTYLKLLKHYCYILLKYISDISDDALYAKVNSMPKKKNKQPPADYNVYNGIIYLTFYL